MSNLWIHAVYSLGRLAAGGMLALCVGGGVGVLAGYWRPLRRVCLPVVYLLAPIPKIALLPLVFLLCGIGEGSKILLIFLVMVFPAVLAAAGAVGRIPEEYFLPLRSAGAGHGFLLRRVVLPACLPELLTAARVGLATGISVLFFAETFGTRFGLGFYIMDMWMRLNYPAMAGGIAAVSLIGLAGTVGIDLLERRICRWK